MWWASPIIEIDMSCLVLMQVMGSEVLPHPVQVMQEQAWPISFKSCNTFIIVQAVIQ